MNYTPEQAAERLHVSKATLAFWRTKGTGPKFFYAGRHPLYREAALAAWEKEQEDAQSAKTARRSNVA